MLDWSQAEKYYDLNNSAGFFMAVLEVEKMLRHVLATKKYPGKDLEVQVQWAKKLLSAPQTFTNARAFTLDILELNYPKIISKAQTEEILKSYFTAVTELDSASQGKIRKLRMSYQAKYLKIKAIKILSSLLLVTAIATILILFLDGTKAGEKTIATLIKFANIIAYRALPVLLGIITLLAIVTGLALRKHKKKASLSVIEHKPEPNAEKIR